MLLRITHLKYVLRTGGVTSTIISILCIYSWFLYVLIIRASQKNRVNFTCWLLKIKLWVAFSFSVLQPWAHSWHGQCFLLHVLGTPVPPRSFCDSQCNWSPDCLHRECWPGGLILSSGVMSVQRKGQGKPHFTRRNFKCRFRIRNEMSDCVELKTHGPCLPACTPCARWGRLSCIWHWKTHLRTFLIR